MKSSDISEVQKMYSSLDTEKCWKLSTEKIVEQEMEKFAVCCKVEQYVS